MAGLFFLRLRSDSSSTLLSIVNAADVPAAVTVSHRDATVGRAGAENAFTSGFSWARGAPGAYVGAFLRGDGMSRCSNCEGRVMQSPLGVAQTALPVSGPREHRANGSRVGRRLPTARHSQHPMRERRAFARLERRGSRSVRPGAHHDRGCLARQWSGRAPSVRRPSAPASPTARRQRRSLVTDARAGAAINDTSVRCAAARHRSRARSRGERRRRVDTG
jgi:hypothetical protein